MSNEAFMTDFLAGRLAGQTRPPSYNDCSRLAEIEAIHASLMAQPALSDDTLQPGKRVFWVYGDEVARLEQSK